MSVLGLPGETGLPPVVKTRIMLSDGRELFYFDAEPTDRSAPDTRELPTTDTHSLIRLDPVMDEWTVVASHRQSRTYLPPADQCPLDPSTPERPTEIPASSYDVVVFENRFPSLPRAPRPTRARRRSSPVPATAGARSSVSPPTTTRRSPP